MSETPRNDDDQQFHDPTAPSYDGPAADPGVADEPDPDTAQDAGRTWSGASPTEQLPTGSTQQLPTPPGELPPPPQSPYAAPPPPGASSGAAPGGGPYASQPYPSQGQVQAGGYGPPPPGYGQPGGYGAAPAPGGYGGPRQLSGNTIALLVVAGLTTLGCGFGIVALIFAIIAATKGDQPAEQAKYTRWGWIAEVVGLAFVVIAIVLVVIFGIAVSSSGSSNGY